MRIARYSQDDVIRYGVVDLEADGSGHPDTVSDLSGDPFAGPVTLTGVRHALADVRLLAPVLPRSKVIGIAGNAGECGYPAGLPSLFLKPNTSVIGPGEAIQVPGASSDTVAGGVLAIVIGRICRSVPPARVPEVVFGYTVSNDVSARDLRVPGMPWGASTCWDTFTPLGPWIVTHLSLEEADGLAVTSAVDEALVARGATRALHHGVAELVSDVSGIMTLLPGDLILTGAPGGPVPIRAGTEVSIDIEEIGTLVNPVIGEDS